jgi:predicted Rossmann fold nucleotide-binding protein DprA/Smf involved in DNA uptake
MKYSYLFPGMLDYPAELGSTWRGEQLPVLTAAGNTGLVRLGAMCLLSSSEIPPDLILPAFDLAMRLREAAVPVAGGFQGEVEAECLSVLLRGTGPLIICPARSLDTMSVPARHQGRLDAGSLLYLSSERPACRRPTLQVAMRRNDLLVGLANRLITLSAPPGSRALKSAIGFLERGRPVACFDHRKNRDLLLMGAHPIPPRGACLVPSSFGRSARHERHTDPISAFLCGMETIPRAGPDGGRAEALSRASPACR